MRATFTELKLRPLFVRHIISGVMAPGDVNIIAIEKVIPKNIGTAAEIFLLCVLETK